MSPGGAGASMYREGISNAYVFLYLTLETFGREGKHYDDLMPGAIETRSSPRLLSGFHCYFGESVYLVIGLPKCPPGYGFRKQCFYFIDGISRKKPHAPPCAFTLKYRERFTILNMTPLVIHRLRARAFFGKFNKTSGSQLRGL